MRVLITDHHLPGAELPAADVIVNPNQPGCQFPSKCLAGVGVAFYVLAALRAKLREIGGFTGRSEPKLSRYLDLVAVGTVADVVPLDRNNRILVSQGLVQFRRGLARPGLQALLGVAGRRAEDLVAADLGFALGPRLNAAGRLDDMSAGIACLLSDNDVDAQKIARHLDALNRERRDIQKEMQDEALRAVAALERGKATMPLTFCVYQEHWHEGVVGLVAGRLKDRHHRPAIAFAPATDGVSLKGSARSVPGFHIRDALDAVATAHPGLITRFGGHAMAAGLTLGKDRLDEFTQAFETEASRWLDPAQLDGVLETDGCLPVESISVESSDRLQSAGPWGQGFPEPLFDGEFEVLEKRVVGERHLKLRLAVRGASRPLDAIAFNTSPEHAGSGRVRAVYRLGVDDYSGSRRLQLVIEYLEPLVV
jgi:single-stranded-DNA-specific exonuclease